MNDSDDQLLPVHRKAAQGSIRLYRRLLVAYPRKFREEYGEEMARYFGELCEDSLRQGGLLALAAVWLRALWDLARSSRAERKRSVPDIDIDAPSATALSLLVCPGAGQAYNRQFAKAMTHPPLFVAASIVAGLLPWNGGMIGVTMVCLWAYSAIDALVSARRIRALQRASL